MVLFWFIAWIHSPDTRYHGLLSWLIIFCSQGGMYWIICNIWRRHNGETVTKIPVISIDITLASCALLDQLHITISCADHQYYSLVDHQSSTVLNAHNLFNFKFWWGPIAMDRNTSEPFHITRRLYKVILVSRLVLIFPFYLGFVLLIYIKTDTSVWNKTIPRNQCQERIYSDENN